MAVNCLMRCWKKCMLEHNSPSDFYVSCWQSSHLSWPLLLLRAFLFLYPLSVVVTAIILDPYISYRFMYFTHWGFFAILLETGFSMAISAYTHYKRPIGKQLLFFATLVGHDSSPCSSKYLVQQMFIVIVEVQR
jgi:hypothetical protein